jgi:hypothetical protein
MKDQRPSIEVTLVRAFKHGRYVSRNEAAMLSQGLMDEQDRYIQTRSNGELKSVVRYANEKLRRIQLKAKSNG